MLKPASLIVRGLNILRRIANRVFFAVWSHTFCTPVFSYTRAYTRSVHAYWWTSEKKRLLIGTTAAVVVLVGLAVNFSAYQPARAAVSDNLNFQARLEKANGAIANDGNYNIRFRLYNASSGGSALWTESYLNSASQGVRVVNGYVSVNLGSVTAFPNNISWDQDMYITMEVGGTSTGTPTWDGEMNPRLKLTAVPYAFQAKSATQLQAGDSGNIATLSFTTPTQNNSIVLPNASGTVCLQSNTACGFAASTGATGYIWNGTAQQTANLNVVSANAASVTAIIQGASGQSANIFEVRDALGSPGFGVNQFGNAFVGPTSSIGGRLGVGTGSAGARGVIIQGASGQTANLFQLQDNGANINAAFNGTGAQLTLGRASGMTGQLVLNNSSGAGGITLQGTATAGSYVLNLPAENGTLCSTGSICAGYAAAATSGNFVELAPTGPQTDSSTNASLAINKTGASGNLLTLQKNGVNIATIGNTGATLFRNSSNSTTAFQIQNAAGTSNLFMADTTNSKIGIGVVPSSGLVHTLQVDSGGIYSAGHFQSATNIYADGSFVLNTASTSAGTLSRRAIAGGTVSANDVVVMDSSAQVVTTATARDTRVYGVAGSAATSGTQTPVAITGNIIVNADASYGAIAIGDQLVTSPTSGHVMKDNGATTGILGYATTALASGTGTVGIRLQVVTGQSAPIFRNTANSTAAFQIQNAAGNSNLFIADTTNNVVGIGTTPTTSGGTTKLDVGGTTRSVDYTIAGISNTSGAYMKGQLVGTGGVSQYDVVVLGPDSGAGGATRAMSTTTARDNRVYGVAVASASAESSLWIAISGSYTVNADTAAIAVGDQLVTSTTAGRVTADNNATTGVLGFATTSKAAGSNGTVGVRIQVAAGQYSPTFRNAANSTVAFRIQNAAGTNLFTADTTNSRLAVGSAAVPANGVLTVGTDTTTATGGLYFGTDTNLYRYATGSLQTDGGLRVGSTLRVQNGVGFGGDNQSGNQLTVFSTAAANRAIVVRGAASQTGDLLQLQDASSNIHGAFNGDGSQLTLGRAAVSGTVSQGKLVLSDGTTSGYQLTLQAGTLDQSQTIVIPTTVGASDQVCLQSLANCTGTGGGIAGSGTQNYLAKFDTAGGNHVGNSIIYDNGSSVSLNTNSTTAFKVEQTGVRNNTLVVDTTNGLVGIGQAPSPASSAILQVTGPVAATGSIDTNTQLRVSNASASAGVISKTASAGTTGVLINDVVVMTNEGGAYKVITSATARDARVYGVSVSTGSSGSSPTIAIGGNYLVNADTGAINIGDQLVTSAYTDVSHPNGGYVTVDNNATTGIIGYATTAKTAGAVGTVGLRIQVTTGQYSPTFRNATDNATAFRVQNAAGTSLLYVDTLNSNVVANGMCVAGWGGVGIGTGCSNAAKLSVATAAVGAQINVMGSTSDILQLQDDGVDVFTVGDEGATLLRNSTDSTTALRVQNAAGTNLLVVDTTNQRLAVGPAAVPANGLLTVGTNTTTAAGGIYFGTDTILYRNGGSSLRTGGSLNVDGNLVLVSCDTVTAKFCVNTSGIGANINVSGANDIFNLRTGGTLVTQVTSTGSTLFKNASDSSSGFTVQNASSAQLLNVNTTNGTTSISGARSAEIGAWTTGPNLPAVREEHTGVYSNGYLYVLGGSTTYPAASPTNSVAYSAVSSTNGSMGAWASATNLPAALFEGAAASHNGYIYYTGGQDGSNTYSTVYYAKQNANGTLGGWATANALPGVRREHTATVVNGYLYVVGGYTASAITQSTVYYAKINSDGSLGSWATGTVLPSGRNYHAAASANGYLYIVGGQNSANAATVYYAKPDAVTGAISAWTTSANPLPAAYRLGWAVTNNNYLYYIGGYDGAGSALIRYAPLNALTGANGGWTTNATNRPTINWFNNVVAANGYFYETGGGFAINTTRYAALTSLTSNNVMEIQTNGGNTATVNGSGHVVIQNSMDATSSFQIQNASGQSLFVADTFNQRLAVGPGAVPATSVLTVGSNTTSADGGITFGTDTSLYRFGSNVLGTDSRLLINAATGGAFGLSVRTAGDSNDRLQVLGNGTLQFGSGSGLADTNLYRSAADALKTDDSFTVQTAIDTANAFRILAANSNPILTVDSVNQTLGLGAVASGEAKLYVSTGLVGARINQIGSSNLLELQSAGTNVATVSSTGAAVFMNSSNSTTAFQIQNAAGTSNLFVADTTNSRIGIGKTPTQGALDVIGSIYASQSLFATGVIQNSNVALNAGVFNKAYNSTGTVNVGDVAVFNASGLIERTSQARDSRVAGVVTYSSGGVVNIGVAGNAVVNVDEAEVAIGDQLVISSTPGLATADNNATTGIVGFATSAKAAGSSGTVGITIRTVSGQSAPRFQNSVDSTTAFQIQNAAGTALLTADTTNSQLSVRGSNSDATLGVELITTTDFTNPAWTSTGWNTTTTTATHNTGNTSALSTNQFSVVAGTTYLVTYTLNIPIAGTLTPQIGGVNGTSASNNQGSGSLSVSQIITASTTGSFQLVPNSAFNGTVSAVSVKAIVASTNNSVLQLQNSGGTTSLEVRASGSTTNAFIGLNTGRANAAGTNNAGFGTGALQANVTGSDNAAFGYTSLQNNINGSRNTAVGSQTLKSNLSGLGNTAVGAQSLQANTYGSFNVSVGDSALYANTIGAYNNALGYRALVSNISGSSNVAMGISALAVNTTANNSTALGYLALGQSNAANSVGIGSAAGYNITSGANNTLLGARSGQVDTDGFSTVGTVQNSTALGYSAQVQASNSLILGGTGANAVNVGIGTTAPANLLSVSPVLYSAGTASRTNASATVLGTGTTWTSSMVGKEIIFADGFKSTVAGVTDTTTLAMAVNATTTDASPVKYRIHQAALQVTSSGNVGIGTLNPTATLDVAGTLNVTGSVGSITTSSGGNNLNFSREGVNYITATGASGSLHLGAGGNFSSLRIASNGAITAQNATDSTTAFQVQNAAGTSNLLVADTTNSRIGIGKVPAQGALDVNGTIFASGSLVADGIGGCNLGYKLCIQTAGAGAKINVTATNNILELENNGTDVVTVGSTGSTIFRNSADSNSAFQIQNAAGTSIFNVDTTGGGFTAGTVGVVSNINGTLNVSNGLSTSYVRAGSVYEVSRTTSSDVTGADVLVYDSSGTVTQTTTARDPRVMGVARSTASTGQSAAVAISGEATVKVDTGAVSVGDQLVTSTTVNRATVDNNATTGIIGIALASKAAGSNGSVNALIRPVGGQYSPLFRNAVDSTAAFRIQNAAGSNMFNVDTTTSQIGAEILNLGGAYYGARLNVSTAGDAAVLNVTGSSNILQLRNNGTNVVTVAASGGSTFRNSSNSTTAFQIQNSSGANLFTVDTTNNRTAIGPSAVPANAALTIGTNTTTADGGMYFGTDTSLYRAGTGVLRTGGSFASSSVMWANYLTANQVALGYINGSTTGPGITFSSTMDTNLYRSAAGVLKTDSSFQVAGTGTSYVMGPLGLGTTNPQAASALTIANGSWMTAVDSTGSGFVNMFKVNANNEIQVGAAMNVDGGIVLPTNGGQLTLVDMPIDATASAGTVQSYSFRVGSTNALTVYGQADGSGNSQNLRVAVGSSISPQYTLDVGGDINSSTMYRVNGVQIASTNLSDGSNLAKLNGTQTFTGANTLQNTSTTAFRIQNTGGSTTLFVADTTNSRLAVGPAAVAANAVLTVGTNTTVASGGIYFGTDTALYRSAANTLTTPGAVVIGGALQVDNITLTGACCGTGINFANKNMVGLNSITIADSGAGEGFSWSDASWSIDNSDLARSNTAGNLNLYGTTGNVAVWRPALFVQNATSYATATAGANGSLAFTSTGTGGVSFRNGSDSTAALQIQNAAGTGLFTADASNLLIKIGTGTPTLPSTGLGDLFVTGSLEVLGAVLIGTSSNGAMFDGTTHELVFTGTARHARTVTLAPSYAGSAIRGDGSNNTGTMSTSFCSGSSKLNIPASGNPCGANDQRTYYEWTANATNDNDIWVTYKLPTDFSAFDTNAFTFHGWGSTSSETAILTLYNGSTSCGTFTLTGDGSWQSNNITATTINSNCAGLAAGDVLTIDVKLTVGTNGNFARAGEILVNYLSRY